MTLVKTLWDHFPAQSRHSDWAHTHAACGTEGKARVLKCANKTHPTPCPVSPAVRENDHSSFHLWQGETAGNTTARDYSDRKDKQCILQLWLKGLLWLEMGRAFLCTGASFWSRLCPPFWFLLPWAFLKLGSKVHLTANPSSVNDFEGSTRKVYRTHLQGDTIASPQILFLIIQILKHKKGTTKIFSGLQPTGTASNHKLNAGYPILQRLTQTSAFIGNCSNMAGQTDGPSSQITFFFCLPITASQRGGSEVCGGSAGCCGKSRQMGAGLLLSNTYSPNNLWRWVGISRDDWPHPSQVGRRSLCRPPSLLNFEGTRMTRLDETANF